MPPELESRSSGIKLTSSDFYIKQLQHLVKFKTIVLVLALRKIKSIMT